MRPIQIRKSPHHSQYYRVTSGIHFLTICTHQRKKILQNEVFHQTLLQLWMDSNHWIVGKYVILPDHIHLFTKASGKSSMPLKDWVYYWRSRFVYSHSNSVSKPFWQRDFWDTQLRRADSYTSKWRYVENNPVRHGYVENSRDWPFKGEIFVFENR